MRLDPLIEGNDAVQRHVASEREKQALVAVSPMARRAIQQEILPQIEESVFSAKAAETIATDTKRAIEAAFSYKNALYTRLVNYKGIEQSDTQFLADLMVVMDEWLRGTKARLEDDAEEKEEEAPAKEDAAPPAGSKDQEVNVDVNVNVNGQEQETEDEESESGDDEGESEVSVKVRDDDDGPEIEVDSPASVFDLADVRV